MDSKREHWPDQLCRLQVTLQLGYACLPEQASAGAMTAWLQQNCLYTSRPGGEQAHAARLTWRRPHCQHLFHLRLLCRGTKNLHRPISTCTHPYNTMLHQQAHVPACTPEVTLCTAPDVSPGACQAVGPPALLERGPCPSNSCPQQLRCSPSCRPCLASQGCCAAGGGGAGLAQACLHTLAACAAGGLTLEACRGQTQLCKCKTCLISHSHSGSAQWVLDLERVCGCHRPARLDMEGTHPAVMQAEVAGTQIQLQTGTDIQLQQAQSHSPN